MGGDDGGNGGSCGGEGGSGGSVGGGGEGGGFTNTFSFMKLPAGHRVQRASPVCVV